MSQKYYYYYLDEQNNEVNISKMLNLNYSELKGIYCAHINTHLHKMESRYVIVRRIIYTFTFKFNVNKNMVVGTFEIYGDSFELYGKYTEQLTEKELAINHDLCKVNVEPVVSKQNWFEKAFGFSESKYKETQEKFLEMYNREHQTHLNGIKIGNFELVSNGYLNIQFPPAQKSGVVKLENISNNIVVIHQTQNNTTIQVASQFNCLEMATPQYNPERGITCYINDRTQGPICAMSAPAGLAFRNYLFSGGQTSEKQVDTAAELLNYLRTLDGSINWGMKNGYLIFNNEEELKKINRVLSKSTEIRKNARSTIATGSHIDQEVFVTEREPMRLVNHVYCSGLPINREYNPNIVNTDLWDGFAELILEAMYENTLMLACANNIRTKQNNPCYLTLIGGGVFDMKHSQIVRAIQRACNVIAKKGLSLDVKIVHYGNTGAEYESIINQFPAEMNTNSVWDDATWINQSL
jgi:hypothetical protein